MKSEISVKKKLLSLSVTELGISHMREKEWRESQIIVKGQATPGIAKLHHPTAPRYKEFHSFQAVFAFFLPSWPM